MILLYLMLMVVEIPTVGGALLLLHLEQHLATVGLLGSLGCRVVLHVDV